MLPKRLIALAGLVLFALPGLARADDAAVAAGSAVVVGLDYKLDLLALGQRGAPGRTANLDALALAADVDLSRFTPLARTAIHLEGVNSSGDAPSPDLNILQGIDNIEVPHRRARLYQAWIETGFAAEGSSLRLGLSDPTAEFASAESAGFLIASPFGTAPEYAVSGPLGASSYPSTSLSARLKLRWAKDVYAQAMVADARAGGPGDIQGTDTSFRHGVLAIAEAGWTGVGKLAVGGWAYSKPARLWSVAGGENARRSEQFGVYLVADQSLERLSPALKRVNLFTRLGLTDARTTSLRGSIMVGALVRPALDARPDSVLSFGFSHTPFTTVQRELAGQDMDAAEDLLELSYSDQMVRGVRWQPVLQYAPNPAGLRPARPAAIAGLRLHLAFDTLGLKADR